MQLQFFNQRPSQVLWRILILAFLVRVALALAITSFTKDPQAFHFPDTGSYLWPAHQMISTSPAKPVLGRTPGYPLFLIPGLLLGHVESITVFLQILLSCATVYLVYRFAFRLFEDPKIAQISALLYAFEPLSLLFSSALLTETLFTAIFLVFLECFARFLNAPSWKNTLLSVFTLCAATYIRPITYFLPPLLTLILVLWFLITKRHQKKVFLNVLVFFLLSMGLLNLWQQRNRRTDHYKGFDPVSEKNLYFYMAASVLSHEEGITFREMQEKMGYYDHEVYLNNHPEQRAWTLGERYNYMGKEAKRILIQNFPTYLIIHIKGMIQVALDPGAIYYLKVFKAYPRSGNLMSALLKDGLPKTILLLIQKHPQVFWSNMLLALYHGGVLLFAAIGVLNRKLLKRSEPWVLLLACCYFWGLAGGPLAVSRLRHPIMPVVCIIAGSGLFVAIRWYWNRKKSHSLRTNAE